jgi:serine/threonine protein kinase
VVLGKNSIIFFSNKIISKYIFSHVFHGKFGDVDVAIKTAKSLASFCSIHTPTAITNDDTSDAVLKTLIDSLLREARLFSNLKHRNIIQLFGVSPSFSTKNLYLVMEYAHGGALSHLLQRRQSGLYPNVLIQYAKQIADGMRYLHEEACEHIIHRDLKCSNSKKRNRN